MTITKLLVLLLLACTPLLSFAQSQAKMDAAARDALVEAEKKLEEVYAEVLSSYQNDAVFIQNLKTSQELWGKFRAAELKMKFPTREPGYYGSVQSMCLDYYLVTLTNERIDRLRQWLTGTDEGDVCAGTTKIRD